MTENGTGDITIMIIDVVTTGEGTMIEVMTVTMIVVAMIVATMIAITVATVIAMTMTTDRFNAIEKQSVMGRCS
ncbi:hypothetical protein BOO88_14780 [Stutzerimonas stutzeri]|jgi:hypothetical protein|nr:hypothetical protein BOO89_04115 [Stutzerimonas stutzeri]AZO90124.1 hypothetical protein BOO88_14780 [Stutzerimonas stutzeri]